MAFRLANDFFRTDIMNHCELLASTVELDRHDEALLLPILEYLSCAEEETPATRRENLLLEEDQAKSQRCRLASLLRFRRGSSTPLQAESPSQWRSGARLLRFFRIRREKSAAPQQLAASDARSGSSSSNREVTRFYDGHVHLEKNPLHVMKAYVALKSLKGHSFNIFECALIKEGSVDWQLHCSAYMTLLLQTFIFCILIIHNMYRYHHISDDPMIWIITFSTTYFFVMKGLEEFKAAGEFNEVFRSACLDPDRWADKPMLIFNTIANRIISIMVSIFNVYFVVLSESPNDAVLNALALTFILEIDDMAAPKWAESEILEKISKKMHDYIMEPLSSNDADSANDTAKDLAVVKHGSGQFTDDDKLYVCVDLDTSSVVVHKRLGETTYVATTYRVIGRLARVFLETAEKFECLSHFKAIHD